MGVVGDTPKIVMTTRAPEVLKQGMGFSGVHTTQTVSTTEAPVVLKRLFLFFFFCEKMKLHSPIEKSVDVMGEDAKSFDWMNELNLLG